MNDDPLLEHRRCWVTALRSFETPSGVFATA
jgi:hypothetical protein